MSVDGARAPGFWTRSVPGWHAAFAVAVAVAAGSAVTDAGSAPGERGAAVALCAALAAWYALVGRRALGWEDPRLGVVYVAGAVALFCALVVLTPHAFVLLFVLYPQVFACIEDLRRALGATAALSAATVVGRIAQDGWAALSAAALLGLLNFVLAALLGLWTAGVIRESDRRAALLAELERARGELAEAKHREGVLAERQRLAAEIHDTLAQGFTSLLLLIRAADGAVGRDPAAARERLAAAERTASDNLAEARALVAGLGPVDLRRPGGLGGAVRRLVTRFGEETGVAVDLVVTGVDEAGGADEAGGLSAAAEVVLLRVAQEALNNVRKHAGASRVGVRLAVTVDGTVLEVVDDGVGFEPGSAEGFGLRGLTSRVEQLGGSATVTSTPGRGTTLRVVVP